jgi:hypothetical protein
MTADLVPFFITSSVHGTHAFHRSTCLLTGLTPPSLLRRIILSVASNVNNYFKWSQIYITYVLEGGSLVNTAFIEPESSCMSS